MLTNAGGCERRTALLTTVRAAIGHRGQRASVLDRPYLLRLVPTLVIWGTRDRIIPAHHAAVALASNPDAELTLLEGAGHLPHLNRADLVAERLSFFINESRDLTATPGLRHKIRHPPNGSAIAYAYLGQIDPTTAKETR